MKIQLFDKQEVQEFFNAHQKHITIGALVFAGIVILMRRRTVIVVVNNK